MRLFADYPNHVGMPLLQSNVPSTGGILFASANCRRLIPKRSTKQTSKGHP